VYAIRIPSTVAYRLLVYVMIPPILCDGRRWQPHQRRR